MDLFEKFSAVEVKAANCLTDADRQFCEQQQKLYQDAVTGFYQIAVLWTDMCSQQKAVLSCPEDANNEWKKKYLMSHWWPEITVGMIMKHVSTLHKEFISTVVSYLNTTYHLTLDAADIKDGLLPDESRYYEWEETLDRSGVPQTVLRYEDAVDLILSRFQGRTFEEQAPYELVERCHRAAWRDRDHQANFEQNKNLVKILSGACAYGYYRKEKQHSSHEQWDIKDGAKNILRALAYFETGAFDQYPDGIDDLLSEERFLWYDLWEFEDCKKLEKIKLFKNGRMDIRFTSEGYAREFVDSYLGTVW